MFTAALVLAVLLLAFTAFSAFGLPYMVWGMRAFEEFRERRDAQAMGAALLASASLVVALPLFVPALISGVPPVQVIA